MLLNYQLSLILNIGILKNMENKCTIEEETSFHCYVSEK